MPPSVKIIFPVYFLVLTQFLATTRICIPQKFRADGSEVVVSLHKIIQMERFVSPSKEQHLGRIIDALESQASHSLL
jgi:hypothetical protein